jgi:hypothetical protein
MTFDKSFRGFLRNENGGPLVEFLLVLPMLIWALIALIIFWDVFRTMNTAQKAAYSISDVISRQEDNLTPAFVDGMQDVFEYLMINNVNEGKIRITSVIYDESEDEFIKVFSVSPGNKVEPYSDADLQSPAFRDRIPQMDDMDSVVVVETSVDYIYPFRLPFIDAGVVFVDENTPRTMQTFSEFVVTRPRFRARICLETPGCPVGI